MKKGFITWIVTGAAVSAAAVGGGLWFYKSATQAPVYTYKTVKTERKSISARITATGTLSARVTVQVGSQVSGTLKELLFDYNDTVKKGEVVARIEPQLFEAAVSQAKADLAAAYGRLVQAKAQQSDAERKYERAKALHKDQLITTGEMETAETNLETAKAGVAQAAGAVEQARASLYRADINLKFTTIRSPIDGVVISRDVSVGQTVAASLSAPTLFTIAEDLRKMQVDTYIAESDVGKLSPGMATQFVVDAYPNKRFKGTIRQIRNAPQTVQNIVTYDAVIDVDNEKLELKPGMTANVTIIWGERENVLTVPNAALRFRPPPALAGSSSAGPWSGSRRGRSSDGSSRRGGSGEGNAAPSSSTQGEAPPSPSGSVIPPASAWPRSSESDEEIRPEPKAVWALRNGKPERVRVRTGLTDGTTTEITGGDLKEDEEVIIEATGGDDAPASAPPNNRQSSGSPRMRL